MFLLSSLSSSTGGLSSVLRLTSAGFVNSPSFNRVIEFVCSGFVSSLVFVRVYQVAELRIEF